MDHTQRDAKKILLLTAPYGDGHLRAAEAIEEAAGAVAPECEIVLVDYFRRFVPDFITRLSRKAYLDSIRLAPASYGVFYKTIGKVKPDSRMRKMMDSPGRRPLAQYLRQESFDAIISLYPIPSGAVAHLRQQSRAAPLVTVVTDYTCHPEWIHAGTDAYVVGSDSVADLMIERGVGRERIYALGIPVRSAFVQADARSGSVPRGETPRVLVMAGAYGSLGGIRDVMAALEALPGNVGVTFVCGRAEALREKISSLVSHWRTTPRVLGFVEDVACEMVAADLVVSKAGGITVSEALALGRPLVIYKPIPGQEERNCEFLADHGAGVAVRKPEDLTRMLRELLTDRARLLKMGESARRVAKPDAAADIARLAARIAGCPRARA